MLFKCLESLFPTFGNRGGFCRVRVPRVGNVGHASSLSSRRRRIFTTAALEEVKEAPEKENVRRWESRVSNLLRRRRISLVRPVEREGGEGFKMRGSSDAQEQSLCVAEEPGEEYKTKKG